LISYHSPHYLENALFGRRLINKYLQKMMVHDLGANRANEVQSLLEEQTQSLLSVYLQKERSMKRAPEARDTTHLMMLSDLVKGLLAGYSNLNDASLLQMEWLCPLLTSCSQSKDPSIQSAIQTIVDRALMAGAPKGNDAAESIDETAAAKAPAEKKIVADV
jgi:hypothetical protein